MAQSAICFVVLAVVSSVAAAPSGWPVVTYAQSYSAHAVDHSVAQSVYPAVAAAPVVPAAAFAEPLVAAAPTRIATPAAAPLLAVAAPASIAASPLTAAPLAAAPAPLVASPAAPYFPSPYLSYPYAAPYLS